MKQLRKIRKTGEIIEVITWTAEAKYPNDAIDFMSYIDSKGDEHYNERLNFYWDTEEWEEPKVEAIDMKVEKTEDTKKAFVRQLAATLFAQMYAGHVGMWSSTSDAQASINGAKTLAKELEKEGLL